MSEHKKSKDELEPRNRTKEKILPVAENSLAGRPPGVGDMGAPNRQSVLGGGSQQREENAPPRGEVGAQQSGWSSRQQAQRMQARSDETARGIKQQGGDGRAEQYQHAGSQESPTGPSGSQQSGEGGSKHRMGEPGQPASDAGSPAGKRSGVSRR